MNAGQPKVMLVEDDELLRQLLRLTLNIGSVEILEAPDGETALEMARLEEPDVVFLDWTLPGISGLEVCRELRTESNDSDVKIVMLTAHTADDERRQGLEAGADDYLTKPFSPQQLLDKVSDLLGTKALQGSA